MKLSIIIATLNSAKTLQRCLNSIKIQTYRNIEVIVIDGKSTDSTTDIIKSNNLTIAKYISEPDEGIYDAWNKGIKYATGEWFFFIGSDDELHNRNSILDILMIIKNIKNKTAIVYTKVLFIKKNGDAICVGKPWKEIEKLMNSYMCIPHNGVFHHHTIIKKYGFDSSLKVAGDYKFVLQSLKDSIPLFVDNIIVAKQYSGGVSSLRKNRIKVIEEFRKVQFEFGLPITFAWMISYIKSVIWKILFLFYNFKL
jgi:glycosyltransferase involved in cell wall biosynthesis